MVSWLILLNDQMINSEHMEEDLTKHMEEEHCEHSLLVTQATEASRRQS
jgi:hypothetical protein